jgi:hypothetical protein
LRATALAGAEVPDTREQLVEVIGHAGTGRILQPLVVHSEALDEILLQLGGGPVSELSVAGTLDPVAGRQYCREVIVEHLAKCAPGALLTNY